ncbi:hypothetical protein HBB16_13830, partial [Pseudonocardia sp. MCCB 268]|nr:hypothetical protein [Pseudonocardia cytotoxica]
MTHDCSVAGGAAATVELDEAARHPRRRPLTLRSPGRGRRAGHRLRRHPRPALPTTSAAAARPCLIHCSPTASTLPSRPLTVRKVLSILFVVSLFNLAIRNRNEAYR